LARAGEEGRHREFYDEDDARSRHRNRSGRVAVRRAPCTMLLYKRLGVTARARPTLNTAAEVETFGRALGEALRIFKRK
jgi:hypothetical protein